MLTGGSGAETDEETVESLLLIFEQCRVGLRDRLTQRGRQACWSPALDAGHLE